MQPVDDNDQDGGSATVKSARRVFEVLEFFDRHQRPATVIEVATSLEYPQSSTSALMRTMRSLGYLYYRGSDRSYVTTARVALLGQWVDNAYYRDHRLQTLMQDISQRTGETIMLAARNGLHAQYVHAVQASVSMRLFVPNGTLRPLTQSAAGLALLSAHSDAEIARLVRRLNVEENHVQPIVLKTLMQSVKEVREQGYAFSLGLYRPSAGAVAILLPTPEDAPPLALVVAGVIDELRGARDRIIELTRAAIALHLADGPTA